MKVKQQQKKEAEIQYENMNKSCFIHKYSEMFGLLFERRGSITAVRLVLHDFLIVWMFLCLCLCVVFEVKHQTKKKILSNRCHNWNMTVHNGQVQKHFHKSNCQFIIFLTEKVDATQLIIVGRISFGLN